jgi:hypothetical protein
VHRANIRQLAKLLNPLALMMIVLGLVASAIWLLSAVLGSSS